MPQDKELTFMRLNEIWKSDDFPVLEIEANKYILFSDLHLGNGGKADDFHDNEETLLKALKHYKEQGYKLILLGDIEEFWQFGFSEVRNRYQESVYQTMREFGDANVFRIFGNHDGDWCIQPDPAMNEPFLPPQPTEAIKLKDSDGKIRILLVHGHQGSLESDRDSWSSRFWVRLFRFVEPWLKKLGIIRHPPAIKCEIVKDYDRIMYSWAKSAKAMLICGHSHNAIFGSKSHAERLREKMKSLEDKIQSRRSNRDIVEKNKEEIAHIRKEIGREIKKKRDVLPTETAGIPLPVYFNTGCGLYGNGITGIELVNGKIRLVKWYRNPRLAQRYEIYQEGSLIEFLK